MLFATLTTALMDWTTKARKPKEDILLEGRHSRSDSSGRKTTGMSPPTCRLHLDDVATRPRGVAEVESRDLMVGRAASISSTGRCQCPVQLVPGRRGRPASTCTSSTSNVSNNYITNLTSVVPNFVQKVSRYLGLIFNIERQTSPRDGAGEKNSQEINDDFI